MTTPVQTDSELLDSIANDKIWALHALLVGGADPDAAGPQGAAIALAARKGEAGFLQALIAAGANVNGRDSAGDTALMNAVRHGHEENIMLLLEKGANAGCTNPQGESAAGIAEKIFEANALNVHSAALDGSLLPVEQQLLTRWERLAALLKERYAEAVTVKLPANLSVHKPLQFKKRAPA